MEEMIHHDVLGIQFSTPKKEVEQRIMEMSGDEFVAYAKRFIPNPYHPCSYYADPSWFKSREEWQKYEIEGDGHRLIRQENGVKLYWEGTFLKCLVEYYRTHCSG